MNAYLKLLAEKSALLKELRPLESAMNAGISNPTSETRANQISDRLSQISIDLTEHEARKVGAAEIVRLEAGEDRRAQKPFATLADQLAAIKNSALGKASAEQAERLRMVAALGYAGAGEGLDSDGGFLVQTDFSSEILRRMYSMGQILSRARMVPVSGNALEIPGIDESSRATGSRLGGIQGYWVDEGNAPTQTHPKLYKIALKLKKLAALGYASDELLGDAAAFSDLYTQGFAEELTFLTEDAIVEGKGGGQPLGILNADCLVTVAKETGQASATLNLTNIVKMRARMWARSRPNAVWFYNQDIEPQLLTLVLASGNVSIPVYMPAGGASAQPYDTMYGIPMIPIEYGSTLGTVGDIILADMSQYVMISKGGIDQAQSIHVRFTTDEMTFRATYRCDGQPAWRTALTPFKGSNSVSPFVVLATR